MNALELLGLADCGAFHSAETVAYSQEMSSVGTMGGESWSVRREFILATTKMKGA